MGSSNELITVEANCLIKTYTASSYNKVNETKKNPMDLSKINYKNL
jgi:hypothetical protein